MALPLIAFELASVVAFGFVPVSALAMAMTVARRLEVACRSEGRRSLPVSDYRGMANPVKTSKGRARISAVNGC
jgi:hypothetical protein